MSSNQNDVMNVVEVNLNGEKNNQKINSNIYYHEINTYSANKDNDNSGDRLSNNQEDGDEEKEQEEEELSMAEIEHLKKIHEQTMLRSEKYANLYSPQSSDKKSTTDKYSKEKINTSTEDNTNITQNVLEIFNENDNEHFNEQKINPNKERSFTNIHCFFYLDSEPLIIIGPDLGYFIWIFSLVSFFSILVYSLKASAYFTTF